MNIIRILPEHEARKIAAGEVVERPASVVKELIENALDAHATEISLHLINGGKSRIEIRDNGCGMSQEDARLCIAHHATSKLQSIEQLTTISTFGFRGEALASIASVSKLHIVTRQKHDDAGFHIHVEAGNIISEKPIAANIGTTIIVEDLFFNVPARKKFMKQRDTEWRAIQQLTQAIALTFPTLSLNVTHDNQPMLVTQSCATLFERSQQVFGKDIAHHLIPVPKPLKNTPITIEGVISTHQFSRYDRRYMFFTINKRWVKNHILGKALLSGYHNVLPAGKFPCVILSITMPCEEVDVNIHPRKEEVLLLHPHILSNHIEMNINRALNDHISKQLEKDDSMPTIQSAFREPAHRSEPSSFIQHETVNQYEKNRLVNITTNKTKPYQSYSPPHQSVPLSRESSIVDLLNEQLPVPQPTLQPYPDQSPIPVFLKTEELTLQVIPEQQSFIQSNILPTYHIIGQFAATYLLIEVSQGLLLIDQHAAHECIIYQDLVQKETHLVMTKLLFPEFITLAQEDLERITPYIPLLPQLGLEAELWGQQNIMITATIPHLKVTSAADIIFEFLKAIDATLNPNLTALSDHLLHHVRALIACKSAVKAGDQLSLEAQHELVKSYLATEDRRTCPHGRPTSWLIGLHEFERKFKRAG